MRPVNIASKAPYRGANVLSSWASADANGYDSGLSGTFKQWREIGAQVKKGETASYVVFYKQIIIDSDNEEDNETGTRLFTRASPVFAAEQVDGFETPDIEAPNTVIELISQADAFIAATGARIEHNGNRAFYRPSTDGIQLPPRDFFVGTSTSSPSDSYYSTLLHELTHWTSHKDRGNRELGKRFDDEAYAMEELVAELGAAFLCADLRITDPSRRSCSVYRKLASRFESRQESDLHGGFQGFAGGRLPNRTTRNMIDAAYADTLTHKSFDAMRFKRIIPR